MNGSATAVGGDHRAHRRVGRGQRLRHGDDVGDVAEAFAAEAVAEPAPGADHLVGDHQHVVAVADLAHPLEVAVGRDEAAAGVLDRLEDHRGDGLRALEHDPLLDRGRRPERVAVLGPAVDVGVGDVAAARRERLELGAQLGDAGGGEGAERGAVVGDLAGDHLVLLAFAAHAVVVAGQLQRRLDRLRAAGGEEDAVEVAGGERGDPRGELDRARVGVAPERVEVELFDLAGRGLAELGAAVAGVDAEEGGEAVEVALAVLVVDVAALAADDDRDLVVGAVGAHPREVHPEMSLASSWRPVSTAPVDCDAMAMPVSSRATTLWTKLELLWPLCNGQLGQGLGSALYGLYKYGGGSLGHLPLVQGRRTGVPSNDRSAAPAQRDPEKGESDGECSGSDASAFDGRARDSDCRAAATRV